MPPEDIVNASRAYQLGERKERESVQLNLGVIPSSLCSVDKCQRRLFRGLGRGQGADNQARRSVLLKVGTLSVAPGRVFVTVLGRQSKLGMAVRTGFF